MILFEHGLYCRIRQLSLMIHSCWNSMFDHCSSCYGTMAPSWHNQGTNTTLSYVCFLSNENPYNCLYTIRFCVGFCWSGEVRGHDVTVVICYIYRGLCTYTYSILLCLYVHITILLSYIFTIIYIFTHVFVGPKNHCPTRWPSNIWRMPLRWWPRGSCPTCCRNSTWPWRLQM